MRCREHGWFGTKDGDTVENPGDYGTGPISVGFLEHAGYFS